MYYVYASLLMAIGVALFGQFNYLKYKSTRSDLEQAGFDPSYISSNREPIAEDPPVITPGQTVLLLALACVPGLNQLVFIVGLTVVVIIAAILFSRR